MKNGTERHERRERWERFARYGADLLTPEEMAGFDADLGADESLRREFADWLSLEGALRTGGDALFSEKTGVPGNIIAFPRGLRWAAAAALMFGGLGIGWWLRPASEPVVAAMPPASVPESAEVATLADTRACKWGAGSLPTEEGSRLRPGRLELLEGLATLRFDSGVTVTLEAPVTLHVESGTRCRLVKGAAVAWVPEGAEGFQIQTADALLTDYGTRFGVTAGEDGKSQVIVLEGEVGVTHHRVGGEKRLKTGEMVRYDAERMLEKDVGGDGETPRGGPREPRLPAGWVALTTAEGRGQDTCVRQHDAGAPYGNSPLLMVKNSSAYPGNRRKAWLSFDLAPLNRRALAEAELALSIQPSGLGYASVVPDATFRVYGLADESLDHAWDADSLLWADAPANVLDDGFSLDESKVVLLGEFVVEQGVSSGQRTLSGGALADFLAADTNGVATLILVRLTDETDRHGLVHAFASREHPVAMPPTLRVRFEE